MGRDPTVYTDGAIVREGAAGESADGDYSAGRGGAGNMVASPKGGPIGRRSSQDVVPEAALVDHKGHENYHTGRGGGGNVHREGQVQEGLGHHHHGEGKHKESVIDKVKHALHHDKKEEKPALPS